MTGTMPGLDLEELLTETGARRSGHFLLSSGHHSPDYVQCALLLELPSRARLVGRTLAHALEAETPASIVAPALGGLIVGFEVAAALDVPFRFAERRDAAMTISRGFRFQPGERVVVVEDVVTTGRSTLETIAAIEEHDARVVAVGSIIDRGGGGAAFRVPHRSLIRFELETWKASECPLCDQGVALVKPGSRADPVLRA